MKLLNEIKQALKNDYRARTALVVIWAALVATLFIGGSFLIEVLKGAGYW